MKIYLVYKIELTFGDRDGVPALIRIYNNKEFAESVVNMTNTQTSGFHNNPYYIEEHEMFDCNFKQI